MQYLIMHRTTPEWEKGAVATPELVERVGTLIRELVKSGKLLAGDGLRPSSLGVRLLFSAGKRTDLQKGPLAETKGPLEGFVIMRVTSLDAAVEWAARLADAIGDSEIDIRPVTEAWDLGFGERPPDLATTRYMATYKRRGAHAGAALSAGRSSKMSALLAEMERVEVLQSAVHLEPSAKGACLRMANGKPLVIDGPFVEAKELLGGFITIREESLAEAVRWAERYIVVVGTEQVEVRELASAQ